MICIKKGKGYLGVSIPEVGKSAKAGKAPDGENQLDLVKKDIARIRDEMIKKNRNDLDLMYNLDMDNMGADLRRLFSTWTDGVNSALAGVETVTDSQKALVESYTKFQTETSQTVTSIKQQSDANTASITSIAKWQSSTDSTLSSIKQTATEQGARIDLVVTKQDGKDVVNSASITAAIAEDESFIQLIADRVTITGTAEFVKKSDLGESGSTVVSGNRISLNMNGEEDDGSTDLSSTSRLSFRYLLAEDSMSFANIYTNVDGSDTDIASRYALYIQTDPFLNAMGETARPAIKINPYGNLSMESDSGVIYMGAPNGPFVVDAAYCTRIRATESYNGAISEYAASFNDYVFAIDGIYFNGTRILST